MGLFSKPGPLDPRFALPPVKKMECTQLHFPCKSEIAMMNFKWLEKQMAIGKYEERLLTVNRIMETENFWEQIEAANLDGSTDAIVQYVMALESLKLSEEEFTELYVAARFGILAGLFESASKTTDKNACHPEVWNAMSRVNVIRRDGRGGENISEEDSKFLFICQKTTEAGYVMGKVGGLTLGEIFKRWNATR
jgi:hypothetical protein